MTLEEMFDEFELYGFEDFEDSQKRMLLNQAYFDVVTREPWPFLEKVALFTVPANSTQVTNQAFSGSPTDVNSVLSFIDTTNDIVLVPERTDVIEKTYQVNPSDGVAQYYYFVGDELFIYPAADSSISCRLFYTMLPTAVDESTSTTSEDIWLVPKRHHSVIMLGALAKAYLVNDDPQAAAFQNMFESRYQQMRADVWMRQYDRTERIHVMNDSIDWNY